MLYQITSGSDTPEEILEIIGMAQVMGGCPARWEAVHIRDVAFELREQGLLAASFVTVLESIPAPLARR